MNWRNHFPISCYSDSPSVCQLWCLRSVPKDRNSLAKLAQISRVNKSTYFYMMKPITMWKSEPNQSVSRSSAAICGCRSIMVSRFLCLVWNVSDGAPLRGVLYSHFCVSVVDHHRSPHPFHFGAGKLAKVHVHSSTFFLRGSKGKK